MAQDRIVRIILEGSSGSLVQSFNVAGAAAERAQGKFASMQRIGSRVSSLGATMTKLAVPIVAVAGESVKMAASFDTSMQKINALVGVSQKQVKMWSGQILNMAKSLPESPKELADAMYYVTSAGQRGSQALNTLRTSAHAAAAGLGDTSTVVDAVTSAMNAYRNSGTKAADVTDALVAATKAGKMSTADLAASVGQVLPVAAQMGVSFKEVVGTAASLSHVGAPVARTMTGLRFLLTSLEKPASKSVSILQSVGISAGSVSKAIAAHGLLPTLQVLKKRLTLPEFLEVVGGARGVITALGLVGKNAGQVNKVMRQTKDSTGDTAKAFRSMQTSPLNKFKAAVSSVQVSMIRLGNSLMPIVAHYLPKLVSLITGAFGWFTRLPKPVKELVGGFVLFLAVGGPILMFIGKLITAVGIVGDALKGLKLITLSTSAVMKASLVGLVIFALVELVTHFQTVKRIAGDVFNGMKVMVTAAGHAVMAAVHSIGKVFMWLMNNTPFGAVMHMIGGAGGAALKLLQGNVGGAAHSLLGGASSALHAATFGLLHAGGTVKPKYLAGGGPVGSDTIPGWLSPGEFVLNRAATARIGVSNLDRLNNGIGGGQEINVNVSATPVTIAIDGRRVGLAVLRWTVDRAARGPSSMVGGGLMTGTATA